MPSSNATEPTVAIIVQARLGSTRYPAKVLEPLIGGETVLGYLLKRLAGCRNARHVVVATSNTSTDDRLADWLTRHGWGFVRGSENDCLSRYGDAARKVSADITVRITSDCPLVPPGIVDGMITYYLRNRFAIDYLSNRQYTDFPEGIDVEIFRRDMLEDAVRHAVEAREREHINYYFLDRDSRFRIRYFCHGLGSDYSRFKLSIDTPADLNRVQRLFRDGSLPLDFSFEQLTAAILAAEAKGQKEARS